jgi:hypothetical protein
MTTAPANPKTRGEEAAADVYALLRARNAVLWVATREEARAEGLLMEAALKAGFTSRFWDVAQGFTDISGRPVPDLNSDPTNGTDPGAALTMIRRRADSRQEKVLWIMRDLSVWVQPGIAGAAPTRQLRNLARFLPTLPLDCAHAIILISPSASVPTELADDVTLVEWPLPDRAEIGALLEAAVARNFPDQPRESIAPDFDAAVDAAVGLTGMEASGCFGRSLVLLRRIDVATVAKEKKRIITRGSGLEWFDPLPGGLDAVGGLDNLKAWLKARAGAYTKKARAYGLPAPRGALLVGIPGCGKSLTAKAMATAWNVPLLRLDLGAVKSKYVGESEGNLRAALARIEAIGRCVVWLDEIEKALAGATKGAADGGVSADALGTVLSWMQERPGGAFVTATANDVTSLPPELLRKGRFDEIWAIDLPTEAERAAVLKTALVARGRGKLKGIDTKKVAQATVDFAGVEIASLVDTALYSAFADRAREITTADLLEAVSSVTPLAKTAPEKISELRKWAKGRARPASAEVQIEAPAQRERVLDIS